MATIAYDEKYGARTTKVFGCSFKSITAQMGFNSQPIVFTVTIVEENAQDFTLDKDDVRSAQYVSFGELSILGIVQSWEKTTTDPNGTGIYVVRLTDCRTVLDSASIANVYVDTPESEVALIDSNVVYVGSQGDTVAASGSSVEEDKGVLFSTLMERVEAATLRYGNNSFKVDMSALNDLTNWRGEGVGRYFIEGEVRSLVSTITEFCNSVGAEWWVESRRKSVVDDTIIIEIKVVRRLDGIGNPNALGMDEFAALHKDHIIRRKDGYENSDIVTNRVIWGGIKRKLDRIHGVIIRPFWGFDEFGHPLSSPSYTVPDEPQYRRIDTTSTELEHAINGDLDDNMDAGQLAAIKRYAEEVWGKKFYFSLNKNDMSDTGQDLPNYPEVIPAGWWEEDIPPQGVRQFDPDVLIKLTTEDGRWGPFVHLSELFTTGSGTVESPLKPHYVTWAPVVHNSQNLIAREGKSYMKCKADQYGRYVVINLPVALTRYYMDPDTGITDPDRFTRHVSLSQAWVPIMDRGIHYGPWSNTSLAISHTPSPGASEVSVDKDLVPWTFGVRGMTNTQAQLLLTEAAAQKIDTLPGLSVINTGQLEVAGVPMVNIGQSIEIGGSVTEIFIRFDNNGVTTRYVMNLYTRELGEFKRRKQSDREQEDIEDEKEPDDEYPEIKDSIEEPPPWEPSPEVVEEIGLSNHDMDYIYQKPEGGMGVIDSKAGGPFYTVRRTNYADIDPNTFAGGLNITGSYFLAEWHGVRNLAEPTNSPGLLRVGTHVTVSIFSQSDEHGPYLAYIEQTPQVFSPPALPT